MSPCLWKEAQRVLMLKQREERAGCAPKLFVKKNLKGNKEPVPFFISLQASPSLQLILILTQTRSLTLRLVSRENEDHVALLLILRKAVLKILLFWNLESFTVKDEQSSGVVGASLDQIQMWFNIWTDNSN